MTWFYILNWFKMTCFSESIKTSIIYGVINIDLGLKLL